MNTFGGRHNNMVMRGKYQRYQVKLRRLDEIKEEESGLEANMVKEFDEVDKEKKKLEQRDMNGQMDQLIRKQMDQLAHSAITKAKHYAATHLPAPNSLGIIELQNGLKFSPDIDLYIRHGDSLCRGFYILRSADGKGGLVEYPLKFFDNFIMYLHETEMPEKVISLVAIYLPYGSKNPWPTYLRPLSGAKKAYCVPTLKGEEVLYDDRIMRYTLRNKHQPKVMFNLRIWFEPGYGKCHKEMTAFFAWRHSEK